MHDEACPIFEDMIENMMYGHEFILKNFGKKPTIGWQIDPFGHSNTNARFFAEMGFDAFFFARLDYEDKERRMNDKEMEYVWMPNPESLGTDTKILTHVLFAHYCSPGGFDFDMFGVDTPQWINDKKSQDFNAEQRAKDILNNVEDRLKHYLTDDIFMLFGCDFQYMQAHLNYRNLDNMIEYVNANFGDKYHFKYSTPSEYVEALNKKNVTWPTKYDDMMPYGDGGGYWTGYFTSRANLKSYVREVSHKFHASN